MKSFTSLLLVFLLSGVHLVRGVFLNDWFKAHPGKKFWGFVGDYNMIYTGAATRKTAEFGAAMSYRDLYWNITHNPEGNWGSYGLWHFDWFDHGLLNSLLSRWQYAGNAVVSPDGNPPWLNRFNQTALKAEYVNYIKTLTGYYKSITMTDGFELGWIVVEKPLKADGTLRSSIWADNFGEEYIKLAFETAKATHSTPLLHIAEEGLLYNNTKVQSFVQLVKRVNTPTKLIDTIILHVDTAGAAGGVAEAMNILTAATGLEVRLMQADINSAKPDDWLAFAKACLSVPKCAAVYSFGYCDGMTNEYPIKNTASLFDEACSPKPVVSKILALP